jgi:hypothetical protein
MFGGSLPQNRAAMIASQTAEVQREIVLSFPGRHRSRIPATG